MSTTIRLTRMGRRKRPYYRLVVVDSRTRRDGAFIENLGTYNSIPGLYECSVDADRAIHWLDRGASLSDTARSLLRNEGILYRWHLHKTGVAAEEIERKVEEFRTVRAKKADTFRDEETRAREERAKAYAETLKAKRAKAEAASAETAGEAVQANAEATSEGAGQAAGETSDEAADAQGGTEA
jgi:small subunit ribosomal protein S16